MGDVKGYVVRAEFEGDGVFLRRISAGCFLPCPRESATLFTLSEAIEAHRMPKSPPSVVTIFAVGQDGTETPLLNHADALAEIERLNVERERDEAAYVTRCHEAIAAQERASRAEQENTGLRQEIAALKASATAERAVWARLVGATLAEHGATLAMGSEKHAHLVEEWRQDAEKKRAEAENDLRAMGVDVDALLR